MPSRFKPVVDEPICIAGQSYSFDAHPAMKVRRQLYVQEGRRARIYRLREEGTSREFALKEFRLSFHDEALGRVATFLKPFAKIQGMAVAARTVVTAQTDPELFNRYRELQYAVLMPWIGGGTLRTWAEVIAYLQAETRTLTRADAHRLAARFLGVMSELESKGAAHTDISPGNVVCDPERGVVELIDLEELFAPGATEPGKKNAGSAGYRHLALPAEGIWSAEADRFSAAVLAAEMLAASDAGLVAKVREDHFFLDEDDDSRSTGRNSELHDASSPTYLAVLEYLRAYWPAFAAQFERAWLSPTLSAAPTLAALVAALGPAPVEKPFRPAIDLEIAIGGRAYRFTRHPAAQVVYCEKGQRADVYRVADVQTGDLFALKCDRAGTQDERLASQAWYLERQAHLPGMKVARRTVVDEKTGGELFRTARKLRYAVLMPWLGSKMRPWPEIVGDLKSARATLPEAQAQRLANRLLQVLAGLEAQGLAHTTLLDNVMCDPESGEVELIGLESFFGPEWPDSRRLGREAAGGVWSSGTQQGPWSVEADRLSAVILAAEMLAMSNPQLVSMAVGRTYFPVAELGVVTSARYRVLLAHLQKQWAAFARTFEGSWSATAQTQLPSISDSRLALGAGAGERRRPSVPRQSRPPTQPSTPGEDSSVPRRAALPSAPWRHALAAFGVVATLGVTGVVFTRIEHRAPAAVAAAVTQPLGAAQPPGAARPLVAAARLPLTPSRTPGADATPAPSALRSAPPLVVATASVPDASVAPGVTVASEASATFEASPTDPCFDTWSGADSYGGTGSIRMTGSRSGSCGVYMASHSRFNLRDCRISGDRASARASSNDGYSGRIAAVCDETGFHGRLIYDDNSSHAFSLTRRSRRRR